MQKLVLKTGDSKLDLEINGQVYKMTKPKMGRLFGATKENKEDEIKEMVELVVECGLPREVALDLDADAFLEVYYFLNGTKKNS